LQRERLHQITVHPREDNAKHERGHCRPTEPEERSRRDDLADGRLLIVRNLGHRGGLHEVEVPEQADPHYARCNVQPTHGEHPPAVIAQRDARAGRDGQDKH
jgi:hypothetical protein